MNEVSKLDNVQGGNNELADWWDVIESVVCIPCC